MSFRRRSSSTALGFQRPTTRTLRGLALAPILTTVFVLGAASSAVAGPCERVSSLDVPTAEHQEAACLADLTTAATTGTRYTNAADWSGLHAAATQNPSGVPGVQIDGYFPDDSSTNTNHGWNHDSQFVIRLPEHWNGGLVVSGSPGNRRQFANDFIISDWVLAHGYAFAATDKGNTGVAFYRDGARPGDAIAEWHERVTQLTRAADATVGEAYGSGPRRTYVAGISNGGYLVRWALERHPELYDGGVDWEGALWRPNGPNPLTYLPAALRHYPAYRDAGDEAAHQALVEAGFAPGSEFLWDFHYRIYWDLTQRIYREELDPGFDGSTDAGTPFCASGSPACDADYDYFSRPPEVREAVARISNTGRIGRPLITLHGTLDTLLPIAVDSNAYARLLRRQGRKRLHRYYVVEAGNHVDGLYDAFSDRLRPMLPCFRSAFTLMVAWVERGQRPPRDTVVEKPAGGDIVNECSIDKQGRPPDLGPRYTPETQPPTAVRRVLGRAGP